VLGILTMTATDLVITATGGSMGAWRYPILYNDTHASDGLVCFWDRGSSVVLAAGESETLDLSSDTLLTIG
jgi:hypothetical protein